MKLDLDALEAIAKTATPDSATVLHLIKIARAAIKLVNNVEDEIISYDGMELVKNFDAAVRGE